MREYIFYYKVGENVRDQALPNGSIVQPRKSMSITFSKGESKCVYPMNYEEYKLFLGLVKVPYYTLSNPSRVVKIVIKDSNGATTILDGTQQQTAVIKDTDGKGEVVIKSVGLIGSSRDCPNYENVAIVYDKDGKPVILQKDRFMNYLNSLSSPFDFFSIITALQNQALNTLFINSFSSPIRFNDRTSLEGNIDLGSGMFTITADQDYFDSVIYTPPKTVVPEIVSVNVGDIKKDMTGTMTVTIKATSGSGNVYVKAVSDNCYINPPSQNIMLVDVATIPFTVKAPSVGNVKCNIQVQACGVSQFEAVKCDTETKTINILETSPKKYCGDKVCSPDIGENEVNCPLDCVASTAITTSEMKCDSKLLGLIPGSYKVKESRECGFWCKLGLQKEKIITTSGCYYDYTLVIILAILIMAGIAIIVLLKPKAPMPSYAYTHYQPTSRYK
jgi:hypothetical protein